MHEYAYICILVNMHLGCPAGTPESTNGTESDFESILSDFQGPSETPLGSRGDQFSASTRPGRAKETEKDTQSIDYVENSVPDGVPDGITVVPDLHSMLKLCK